MRPESYYKTSNRTTHSSYNIMVIVKSILSLKKRIYLPFQSYYHSIIEMNDGVFVSVLRYECCYGVLCQ